jgi:hypothetical protein
MIAVLATNAFFALLLVGLNYPASNPLAILTLRRI